ncbi:cation:proton antiporter [Humisphaera borealis]|uniref:Cation:proton antiporter n=1 Tax=Humisphaera borealis TaxID=2807512 RepID=A0A7M2WUV4_9BACT|nr:cation:proton antiporter [Humisphaera borealis]QOV88972.1 cation:proton antiporter [Humisphaera borealis]
MDPHDLLPDIGIAILTATVVGLIAHFLRQPIILGYLVAGAVIGPLGLRWIHSAGSVEVISEIGLVLLLFIIGLEMNIKSILAAGKQLLVAGFGQFIVCAAIGVGLFAALGYGLTGSNSDGLYLALMCGLSSTAVVVKLLYDKQELDTLPGRLTLGILVIQDIYAIFVLAFQPNFANPTVAPILKALGATALLLAAGFLFSKYVLRFVFASIAKAPEMVVAVSIGWCAAVAGLAGAMGLSKEMGALVAGVSIAAFPYSVHVTAKTLPLRDFFLTLFFVSLGMKITPLQPSMIAMVAVIVLFVVVSRFVSIYPLLKLSGAGRRTAFITSLNLAQISEFSLVIASLGATKFGHISESTVAMVIYAMAITCVMSSYSIRFSHPLFLAFDRLQGKLGFGRVGDGDVVDTTGHAERPVAILGYHRGGRSMVEQLLGKFPEMAGKLKVVDFNPENLKLLKARGIDGLFGDLSSLDTLHHAHLHQTKVIFCTIPDMLLKGTNNLTLVKGLRLIAPHSKIVATADDDKHEQALLEAGAALAIKPYDLMAERMLPVALEAAEIANDDSSPEHAGPATEGMRSAA